jgi:hypothetical protein
VLAQFGPAAGRCAAIIAVRQALLASTLLISGSTLLFTLSLALAGPASADFVGQNGQAGDFGGGGAAGDSNAAGNGG